MRQNIHVHIFTLAQVGHRSQRRMDAFAVDFTTKIACHTEQGILAFQRHIRYLEGSAIIRNLTHKTLTRLSKSFAVEFEFKDIYGRAALERPLLGKTRNGFVLDGNNFFGSVRRCIIFFGMNIRRNGCVRTCS